MKMRIERAEPKPLQVHEMHEAWYVVTAGPLTKGLLVCAIRENGKSSRLRLIVGGWQVYSWDCSHVYESRYAEADMTTIREKDGALYADPRKTEPIDWENAKYGTWYEVVALPKHLTRYQLAMRCGDALVMCSGDDCCHCPPPLGSVTLRPINPGDKIVFEEEPETTP